MAKGAYGVLGTKGSLSGTGLKGGDHGGLTHVLDIHVDMQFR